MKTGSPGTRAMPRRYPQRPVVGAAGIVIHEEKLLVVERGRPPGKGIWSLPGGVVELGESLERACAREVKEETGLEVEVGPLVEVFQKIVPDPMGKVEYHYVVMDYLCRVVSGRAKAGDDAAKLRWASIHRPDQWGLSPDSRKVVSKGLDLWRKSMG